MVLIIMGVSGSGKTTIGKQMSVESGIPFFDADDFHPKANIIKMDKGIPLNDEDRIPWLKGLNFKLRDCNKKNGGILACSALKESYRKLLSSQVENIKWICLSGPFNIIQERLKHRANHYMKFNLLQSQFDALEIPDYGIHINIENSMNQIIKQISLEFNMHLKSDFGVFGLGVMGKSISLNIAEKGYGISVFNRSDNEEHHIVSDFLDDNRALKNIRGFTDLKAFVTSLKRPRKLLVMIKAGKPIDVLIEHLIPILSEGDIVIDGGNSYFKDTIKRTNYLASKQLNFIGCGISGGEEGARKGPSIMPGGPLEVYKLISPILESISAKDKNKKPCCVHIGNDGAGHFIKMIHNGIEYAEMQLLAELYGMLSLTMGNEAIAEILEKWNKTELSSYLLEITISILRKTENGDSVLDTILDKAGNKGTGSRSSITALNLGSVNTMMSSAVFARYVSSFKDKRVRLSKALSRSKYKVGKPKIVQLEKAYSFARIINHVQGFELMSLASKEYKWNLNCSEIARIWTNGCIIRSVLMEKLVDILSSNNDYLMHKDLFNQLVSSEGDIIKTVQYSLENRVSLDAFWSAYNYWISITTENLPANLVQAQRDYFGAHTYLKRNDANNQFYHTNWYV